MKAMRIHAYGDATALHLDDVPTPEPAPGQVLVRVAATSFNPSEIGLRNGWLRGVFEVDLPYTLGWDLAGTVVALGTPVAPPSDDTVTPPAGSVPPDDAVTPRTGITPRAGTTPRDNAVTPRTGITPRAGITPRDNAVTPRTDITPRAGITPRDNAVTPRTDITPRTGITPRTDITPRTGIAHRGGAMAPRAGIAVGDTVVGHVGGGAAAQFATADAGLLVRAPVAVPLAHAAALPVAGLTAWQAVFEHARIAPGARVLINGAGGGTGGYAVQLARHAGAHVTATASPRSAVTVRALGAHVVHDYTRSALSGSYDAVINLVPLERVAELVPLVRPAGVLVSATNPVEAPPDGSIRTVHFVMRNDPAQLAALVDLVDRGLVRPDIAAERPLAELPEVHRAAEAGRLRGKTLLLPWP